MRHICILCAIRQEIRPFLKRFPTNDSSYCGDFPVWRLQAFDLNVTLIQSGIGMVNAYQATKAAAALGPAVIINAGFCGALSTGIAIGDVFLAEKLYRYSAGSIHGRTTPDHLLNERIGTEIRRGTFITTDEIIEKARVSCLLPDKSAANLLEMESSAVAAACRDHGIEFIAIRSVSDTAAQDPGTIFRNICDNKFNISAAKIAVSLLKRPALLAEYLQLSQNAARAGKSLSAAVAHTLERISCFSSAL